MSELNKVVSTAVQQNESFLVPTTRNLRDDAKNYDRGASPTPLKNFFSGNPGSDLVSDLVFSRPSRCMALIYILGIYINGSMVCQTLYSVEYLTDGHCMICALGLTS